jgi:bifunctional non-homologous end joining protein LigD
LHGERLEGRWSLVRMRGKARERAENWLLVKRTDEAATEAKPSRVKRKSAAGDAYDARDLKGARRRAQPASFLPQLPTLVDAVPEGDGWLHELKLDGYRLVAFLEGGRVRLCTRSGADWTARFPTLATALAGLPVRRAVVDGEAVVLSADGSTDFQALQNSLGDGDAAQHVYFAFDLPHCGGYDLTESPLVERKELLARLLEAHGSRLGRGFGGGWSSAGDGGGAGGTMPIRLVSAACGRAGGTPGWPPLRSRSGANGTVGGPPSRLGPPAAGGR